MEVLMSSADVSTESPAPSAPPQPGEERIEAIILPVSDVDRAKAFYEGLGWRLDIVFEPGPGQRGVQLTPPGSACSIQFGVRITSAKPGSVEGIYLVVSDIEEARAQLIERGAEVSEVTHRGDDGEVVSGRDPERRAYLSRASFSDPDGNQWVLQEVAERWPGR
jgi:catechol 2,3-dioxygenase-like lactoylglutathione lyase family enzyme